MSIFVYKAEELYQWVTEKEDFVLLDVRNAKDFSRFQVEGPHEINMLNVSYFDFMEIEFWMSLISTVKISHLQYNFV